jgi:hypothetical protein
VSCGTSSRDWQTIGPKLVGKTHIFMGDQDTFLLAVASLLTCLVPAVRASAVDPIVTLREE